MFFQYGYLLDKQIILQNDPNGMHSMYDNWANIGHDAYDLDLESIDFKNIDHVVFSGIGGSGTIGDVLSAILSKTNIHTTIVKGYTLPNTIDKNTLVITTSVSGTTIETYTTLESAKKKNCSMIAFSSGGKMSDFCRNNNVVYQNIPMVHSPRASFTSFLFSILNILEPILPIRESDIYESIEALEKTKQNIFSGNLSQENQSLKLSEFIKNLICVYYPAGLSAAAIRFKNSLQENVKIHAMTEDVIESSHNGVVAWEKKSLVNPILIQGKDDNIKTIERFDILKEFFGINKIDYKVVQSIDGGILSKIVNLIYLLDYSTIYASIESKTDPSPVNSIDFIKSRL